MHSIVAVQTIQVWTAIKIVPSEIKMPDIAPRDFACLEDLCDHKSTPEISFVLSVLQRGPLPAKLRHQCVLNIENALNPVMVKVERFQLEPIADSGPSSNAG